jgi:prepilin-type N-terminal cleavage/methylation domain-containing protein
MKNNTHQSGFSLVELLAALTAASMVALTAGIILFYAYRAWTDNKATVERQQDGTVAMTFLAKALRDGTNAVCTTDTLDIGATNATRRFQRSADQILKYYPGGVGGASIVITSNVTAFACTRVTGGVEVSLALETKAGTVTHDTMIHFRN